MYSIKRDNKWWIVTDDDNIGPFDSKRQADDVIVRRLENKGGEGFRETDTPAATCDTEGRYINDVIEICTKAAAVYPDDIDAAVNEATAASKRLPTYQAFVNDLVRQAIVRFVIQARENWRQPSGGWHCTNRKTSGDSLSETEATPARQLKAERYRETESAVGNHFKAEPSRETDRSVGSTKGDPVEEIDRICAEEAERHGDDIPLAVETALKRVKQLQDFANHVDDLMKNAIRSKVHGARHTINVAIRHANNEYGGEPKVKPGEAVISVARSLYAYMIAGRTLGAILGGELDDIADSEEAKSNGHMFNAHLARKLKPLVAENKPVRECVKEAKLKKLFDESYAAAFGT